MRLIYCIGLHHLKGLEKKYGTMRESKGYEKRERYILWSLPPLPHLLLSKFRP